MRNLKILSPDIFGGLKKNPLVSIVGNAGVETRDQRIIQDSDCVIRFNNYATRENIEKTNDPFRCDILFTTFDLHSQGSNPKHVVAGIPYPFKAAEIIDKPAKWYPNSKQWMINPYLNMELCKGLGLNSIGHTHLYSWV